MTIGSGVTTIGDWAFYHCTVLTSIIFLGHDVPTSVSANWIVDTPPEKRGHAYFTSHFPNPGYFFPYGQYGGGVNGQYRGGADGLLMGEAIREIFFVHMPFPALVPVSGKIVDAGGNGLAGVTISLENGSSVLTDAQGNYLIMASQGNHTLTISGEGIETSRTEFNVGSSSLMLDSITPVKVVDSLPLTFAMAIIANGSILALIYVVRRRAVKK